MSAALRAMSMLDVLGISGADTVYSEYSQAIPPQLSAPKCSLALANDVIQETLRFFVRLLCVSLWLSVFLIISVIVIHASGAAFLPVSNGITVTDKERKLSKRRVSLRFIKILNLLLTNP
jgi:hypothetical protein